MDVALTNNFNEPLFVSELENDFSKEKSSEEDGEIVLDPNDDKKDEIQTQQEQEEQVHNEAEFGEGLEDNGLVSFAKEQRDTVDDQACQNIMSVSHQFDNVADETSKGVEELKDSDGSPKCVHSDGSPECVHSDEENGMISSTVHSDHLMMQMIAQADTEYFNCDKIVGFSDDDKEMKYQSSDVLKDNNQVLLSSPEIHERTQSRSPDGEHCAPGEYFTQIKTSEVPNEPSPRNNNRSSASFESGDITKNSETLNFSSASQSPEMESSVPCNASMPQQEISLGNSDEKSPQTHLSPKRYPSDHHLPLPVRNKSPSETTQSYKDSPAQKHISPSSRRQENERKRRRSDSRSPLRRNDHSERKVAHRGRSRSRSPCARDHHRRSPRRHVPSYKSSSNYTSRHRSPRRPQSPPTTNRRTGVGRPGNNLFVAGFSFSTTERDLEKKFSRFGRVKDIRIVRCRRSGDSRGFGFLSLERNEDADAAIRALDHTHWNGRIILVEKSRAP